MNWLLWVALLIAVLGISVLFLTKPDVSPSKIVVEGTVVSADNRGSITIIEFIPTSLLVVTFNDLALSPNSTVSLVGNLQQYKGKLEFVVEDVR